MNLKVYLLVSPTFKSINLSLKRKKNIFKLHIKYIHVEMMTLQIEGNLQVIHIRVCSEQEIYRGCDKPLRFQLFVTAA